MTKAFSQRGSQQVRNSNKNRDHSPIKLPQLATVPTNKTYFVKEAHRMWQYVRKGQLLTQSLDFLRTQLFSHIKFAQNEMRERLTLFLLIISLSL